MPLLLIGGVIGLYVGWNASTDAVSITKYVSFAALLGASGWWFFVRKKA